MSENLRAPGVISGVAIFLGNVLGINIGISKTPKTPQNTPKGPDTSVLKISKF